MKNLTIDEFIIGTLLGDGCISKLTKGAINHRWSCGHSETQLEYLQWKVNFLKNFDLHTGNITKCVSNNTRYLKPCITYHTKSRSNWIFNYYRNLFYNSGKKELPKLVLTPNIITIWYMDDGHLLKVKNKTSKAVFNVHSFSKEERLYLCKQLENFGLKVSLRDKNNEIAISANSMNLFREIVKPLEMFQYKMRS